MLEVVEEGFVGLCPFGGRDGAAFVLPNDRAQWCGLGFEPGAVSVVETTEAEE